MSPEPSLLQDELPQLSQSVFTGYIDFRSRQMRFWTKWASFSVLKYIAVIYVHVFADLLVRSIIIIIQKSQTSLTCFQL